MGHDHALLVIADSGSRHGGKDRFPINNCFYHDRRDLPKWLPSDVLPLGVHPAGMASLERESSLIGIGIGMEE